MRPRGVGEITQQGRPYAGALVHSRKVEQLDRPVLGAECREPLLDRRCDPSVARCPRTVGTRQRTQDVAGPAHDRPQVLVGPETLADRSHDLGLVGEGTHRHRPAEFGVPGTIPGDRPTALVKDGPVACHDPHQRGEQQSRVLAVRAPAVQRLE